MAKRKRAHSSQQNHNETTSEVPRPAILRERERTHGSFWQNAEIAQVIRHLMRVQRGWGNLHDAQKTALDEIALKIGRILSGNPNLEEHWQDIGGYAELGAEAARLLQGGVSVLPGEDTD